MMKLTSTDVPAAYYTMKGKQIKWSAQQELFASLMVTNEPNKGRFTHFSVCLGSSGGSLLMPSSDTWKDAKCN